MKHLSLCILMAVMVSAAGCKSEQPESASSESGELMLFCGAGLRPPVAELVDAFSRENDVKMVVD